MEQRLNSIDLLNDIHTSFNKVLQYSQELRQVHTDKLFEDWKIAKKRFYDAWDGKLIWEAPQPVSFDLSPKERDQRLTEFIAHVYDDLCSDLGEFLERNRDGILTNTLITPEWTDLTGKLHKFPSHMKLSRVIMQLASKEKLCSTDEADYARCRIAELIQETKVTGILCFSVHPLDYLSISENQSQWRSCHALDGEFMSGNLSYMMDPYTIIVYLRSNDSMYLPRFPDDVPWNNKKWRMLLHMDDVHQMIWASRQYPFYNTSALSVVEDIFATNFNKWRYFDKAFTDDSEDYKYYSSTWATWPRFENNTFRKFYKKIGDNEYRTMELSDTWLYWNESLYPVYKLIGNVEGSFNYNDVVDSSTYRPDVLFYGFAFNGCFEPKKIFVGGVPNCIGCGEMPIGYSAVPLCPDCMLKYKQESDWVVSCRKCHKKLLADDAEYWYGDPYCSECYNRLFDK